MKARILHILIVFLVISLVLPNIADAKKHKEKSKKDKSQKINEGTQEPHYQNGEHNEDYEHGASDDKSECVKTNSEESTEPHFHDHTVDEIAHKVTKCPAFDKSHGGCPYSHDDLHLHMDKIKDCPAFKEGCPYKNEDIEKIKNCPAFKDGKCPFDGSHPIDWSKLKDCPAFKEGCPYDKEHHHIEDIVAQHHAHHHDHASTTGEEKAGDVKKCPFASKLGENSMNKEMYHKYHGHHHGHHHDDKENDVAKCPFASMESLDLDALKGCPAFKDGCPFSTQDLKDLKGCPAFKNGCPLSKDGKLDLELLKKCPAFQNGKCPFESYSSKVEMLCPFLKKESLTEKAKKVIRFSGGYSDEEIEDILSEDFVFEKGNEEVSKESFLAVSKSKDKSSKDLRHIATEGNRVVLQSKKKVYIAEFDDKDKLDNLSVYGQ